MAGKRTGFLASPPGKILIGLAGLFLFVLALETLKTAAGSLGSFVRDVLDVDGPAGALGFGWVAAYVVMSGSPVAAMSLTLYASRVLTDVETFLAISGSRLGAALVVLLVGFVYRLRGRDRDTSLQMGVLSLLVTYTIYFPAMLLGVTLLESNALDRVRFSAPGALTSAIDLVFAPIVTALDAALPTAVLFPAGLATMLLAFSFFDRALPNVAAESPARDLQAHVFRPVVMFAIGFAITLVTLSVSVSLGVLVPLSAKGIARRENIIPYIMGANVSTFVDTLVAALLLGAPRASTIVLVEMLSVGLVSLAVILTIYEHYERVLLRAVKWILKSNATLAGFLVIILAVPIVLLFL